MLARRALAAVATTLVIVGALAVFLAFFLVWALAPLAVVLLYWLVDIVVLRRRRPHPPAKREVLASEAEARRRDIERVRGVSAEKLL